MPTIILLVFGFVLGTASLAAAVPAPLAMPSDPRAQFVAGNATTCAQAGFADSIRLGAPDSDAAADAYLTGTTREGRYLDVAITPAGATAGVVIDAVVVKGGDGHNRYIDPAVLPPTLQPPQDYISPFVGADNIPQISHWFVCYHFGPPPAGSLLVNKHVVPPAGLPAEPLPVSFSVLVTCDAPGFVPTVLTFGRAGGVALNAESVLIEDLPVGTTCAIEELNTDDFPTGAVVSFSPGSTVQISGAAGVEIDVTNDFSGIAIQQGGLTITKVVESTLPADQLPAAFVVEYACLDGTEGSVTLPATGGTSAPIATAADTYCAIAEATASLPPGWTVTYQSGDQTSTTGLIVHVPDEPVTVTVTNTSPSPSPSPTPCPTPSPSPTPCVSPPSPADSGGPELAESGGATTGLAAAGIALLLAGGVVFSNREAWIVADRRRRTAR